ncbi:helix-turn-helix transcriptional regulator [Streptomyces galbus]|uniref:helix-turn-helix transcriptional regulator n=1 Tax=Streptomyces galbus TaxID=33898 RepID=UPI00144A52B0|nr:LuxR family transcriptional regulator [Streptomyces galbus]
MRLLAALRTIYEESRRGEGRVAIVHGPVGCGKTELLHDFADHVGAQDGIYLSATASRDEQTVPFGLLAHLLHDDRIAPELRAKAAWCASEGQAAPQEPDRSGESPGDVAPQIFHEMCLALLDVVEHAPGPVVLGIDDMHYADTASLRCLSYVVRRLRSSPLLIVLNEAPHSRRLATLSEAEWPAEPLVRRLKLPLLSPQGLEEVIAGRLGRAAAEALAADAYRVTGGNPALLRGLIEDNRGTVVSSAPVFRVADGYGQALTSCLFRCEPEVLHVARQLAVLDEAPSVPVLAQLTGMDPDSAARALELLRETGLLSGGLLRHAGANSAVLSGMTPEQRADLQVNTANVLFKNGFPTDTVARHLLAASRVDSDCAIPVLQEAAQQAVADGDLDFALDCLRMALQYDTDEQRRAATTAMIMQATWRREPYAAYRRVEGLVEDSRAGRLTGQHATSVIDALMWFGRPSEAIDLLMRGARADPGAHDLVGASHLEACHAWLDTLYPGRGGGHAARIPHAHEITGGGVAPDAWAKSRAAQLFRWNLTTPPDNGRVREAQQSLSHYTLTDGTAPLLLVALGTLLQAERLQEAGARSEELARLAGQASFTVWEALFRSMRAEVFLRQGEPVAAEREADQAVALLPVRNWGILLGLPLATALQANALTGHTAAWATEAQTVLPQAIFETPYGVRLLHARGHRHLAGGQVSAALGDFQGAGELAERLGLDHPVVLPWRTSAAQALIRLGDRKQARTLLGEQLRACGPDQPRIYAEALRALAAASPLQERHKLLNQASEHLQTCEAPLELAFALHDLGWAWQEQGQYTKGRQIVRRAALMAERRGVRIPAPATHRLNHDEQDRPATPTARPVRAAEVLSDAEMRVAQLAVGGYSNRQIASRLFVTVSTVEQHLTRIYRKLDIRRRTDLVGALQRAEPVERDQLAS